MTRLHLGVDPGAKGAFAIVRAHDGQITLIDVVDMPDLEGAPLGTFIASMLADWAPHEITSAFVERVHSMPKQGVASTFRFGKNFGAILGALGALGVPTHLPTPQEWKKAERVTADKSGCRQRASELWPTEAHRFALVKHDGRAEASLLARYGARMEGTR